MYTWRKHSIGILTKGCWVAIVMKFFRKSIPSDDNIYDLQTRSRHEYMEYSSVICSRMSAVAGVGFAP